MQIGYARVSRDDQDTELQLSAIRAAGAERIYEESASGSRMNRPELQRMLDSLRDKDVVVVWKIDRLSRSLLDLLRILERLRSAGTGLRSLTEPVDTTTPAGTMLMQMLGCFAEFERSMIRARTKAGLEVARLRGRLGGRPPKLDRVQREEILAMVQSGRKTQAEAARLFGVHPTTVGRLVARSREEGV